MLVSDINLMKQQDIYMHMYVNMYIQGYEHVQVHVLYAYQTMTFHIVITFISLISVQ
jgi:hypothetical protein